MSKMIRNFEEVERLVNEAEAKSKQANLVEKTNPELFKKLVYEAKDLIKKAEELIVI